MGTVSNNLATRVGSGSRFRGKVNSLSEFVAGVNGGLRGAALGEESPAVAIAGLRVESQSATSGIPGQLIVESESLAACHIASNEISGATTTAPTEKGSRMSADPWELLPTQHGKVPKRA